MRTWSPTRWHVHGATVLVAVATLATAFRPAWGAIYSDIQGDPAQRAIERLTAKGIMRSSADGKFNPTGQVTRSELAVFLGRALGLTAPGSLPEFKDSAEIPKEAVPAILAMLNLGTASPQKAQLKKGALIYTLLVDKGVYAPTEQVILKFTIENTSDKVVYFEYVRAQFFDFIIRNLDTHEEVARWSIGKSFGPMPDPLPLAAGQKFEFPHSKGTIWQQLNQNDRPVPPGRYEITAIQPTKTNPTSVSIIFNKGLMLGYPDNTWRPKQLVTRAEAAAVIVRSMGLGEIPPTVPLGVADAAEIPEGVRGAVAMAIEKKIMPPTAQRTFQPARPVTRSELAWALDVLMDSEKRYDFSKGLLKDIAVGNPTLVVIEDERKSFRTFRMARAYAVYRNDKLVDLKDLRPGDTVLLLKIGDVGDVAYIEATGR